MGHYLQVIDTLYLMYKWKFVTVNFYEITNTWINPLFSSDVIIYTYFWDNCMCQILVTYIKWISYHTNIIWMSNIIMTITAICKMSPCPLPQPDKAYGISHYHKCIKRSKHICINEYDRQRYINYQHVITFFTSWYLLNYKQKPDSKILIKFNLLVCSFMPRPMGHISPYWTED